MIKFCCSDCQKEYKVPDDFAGKRVKCKKCGNVEVVTPEQTSSDTDNGKDAPVVQQYDVSEPTHPCPVCGEDILEIAKKCKHCKEFLDKETKSLIKQNRPPGIGENAGIRMLIPVGRSGFAIAAGYLGLLSLLLIPAPVSIVVSLLGIIDIMKHPKKHGLGRAIFGLIMGLIFTGVLFYACKNDYEVLRDMFGS